VHFLPFAGVVRHRQRRCQLRHSLLLVVIMLVAIVALLLIPFDQTIAPDWRVQVVNEKGEPLAGVTVRESWQQYSLEPSNDEEDQNTGADGSVHFARRTLRSSLLSRFNGCVGEIARMGAHASCGPHAHVFAFGRGLGTLDWRDIADSDARPGRFQKSILVLRRCPPGHFGVGCIMSEEDLEPPREKRR